MTHSSSHHRRGLEVAAGILINAQGELLLAQRPEGKPWAGWWEFPGGKLEQGEQVQQALERELKEELGITVTESVPWLRLRYEYASGPVNLNFCKIFAWNGEPEGLENQQFGWKSLPQLVQAAIASGRKQGTPVQERVLPWLSQSCGPSAASPMDLLPASLKPIMWLQLPNEYFITPDLSPAAAPAFLAQLEQAARSGCRMLQFRQPAWPDGPASASLREMFLQVSALCRRYGMMLLVNSCHPRSWWLEADGVQLRAADAVQLDERPLPADKWLGISAHHMADVLYSHILDADFVLLGHVRPTRSHPGQPELGWTDFTSLAEQAGRPVYALGGVLRSDLSLARRHYAHGVAGISDFFPSES